MNLNLIGPTLMMLKDWRVALVLIAAAVALVMYFSSTTEGFDSSGRTLTLYYHPECGHCKAMMPEWHKLGNSVNGTIIKKVNCVEHPEEINKNNLLGFPTIILTGPGIRKVYHGPRTAQALLEFVAS